MDLSTRYLGFTLENPIIPGASPLTRDVSQVRRLVEAGASMIVMPSIFQEQLEREQVGLNYGLEQADESFGEAMSYLPRPEEFRLGPEEYLERLARIKSAVGIPVVASLNARTAGGWVKFARLLHSAGADALELNLYEPLMDMGRDANTIEAAAAETVAEVCRSVSMPVAVKISPNYTNLRHFALRLEQAGAAAVVLFNRYYQPELDVENLETVPKLILSTSQELLPRLRTVASLYGHCRMEMAVTGGVHVVQDVLKATMAGATAVQMASALIQRGPEYLGELRQGVARWLEEHEYGSLSQARGSLSLLKTANPEAFERGNYARILQSWTTH